MIFTDLLGCLGIEKPIFQGGMAWVSEANLAAAVSNAGGLGIISAMNLDADYLRGQIAKIRTLTSKPFGVNIMLLSPHVDAVAQVVAQERVPVVTTGAGYPGKYMPAWIEAGIKVVPVVPSIAIAKRCERIGATAVVAEGTEAGGHIGEITTMALVPQIVDAVKIPVVAAGGIADGRGIAAALMLGAQGVQCGTRFLCAEECAIHENYKQKIIASREIDTAVTGRRFGHPVRALKSPFVRAYAALEADENVPSDELDRFGAGALRMAVKDGDLEKGCFMAGQVASMVKEVMSAQAIIDEMFEQAEVALSEGAKWVR